MTFTEIKTEIKDRLGFSATDDDTRVGRAINRFYKEVTSSLGIKHTSRRTTVSASCSIGVSTLQFTSAEKVVNVFNRNSTPYMQLEEVTVDELRSQMPFTASDTPSQYAIDTIASDSVTILLNCIPQTTFALYADVYATKATLSGSDEPAFPESYHDLLVNGPLIDEYLKLEKPGLSSKAEQRFKERLSELRHWIAVSTTKKEYQGKSTENAFGRVGGTSGGSGSANGSLSYTQSGLITFDRSASGAGLAPFAVDSDSMAVVTNLDADMVDGHHVTALAQIDGTANAGNLLFVDATYDIGASGATRPRDLFLSRNADIDGTLDVAGVSTLRGNLLFSADATHDIGAAGATRPRDFHMSRNALIGGTLGVTGATTLSSTLAVTGATTLSSTLDVTGIITGRHITRVANTDTGTQNNWAPGFANGTTWVFWAGASDITVTGFAGGAIGEMVIFVNGTASSVAYFPHQSGSSSAGNKLYNAVTSASTPVAPGGWATWIYDSSTWVLVAHEQGAWITPTFAAGDYTAETGNWTVASGDRYAMKYHLTGKTLTVTWGLDTTTTSATPVYLSIGNGQWGGFTSTGTHDGTHAYLDNNTAGTGLSRVAASGTNIVLYKNLSGTAWQAATDTTYTHGQLVFEAA